MNNLTVIKRIKHRSVELSEAQREQLGTSENGLERPAPPQLSLDLEIVTNACEGVLLQYRTADGSLNRATYQRSVVEAERTAQAEFGIRHDEWQQ